MIKFGSISRHLQLEVFEATKATKATEATLGKKVHVNL